MSATVSETPPRRLRERQRKIDDLLEAAGEVFARRGFHEASMEEIAKAAEYATGTLYRYFPSKEALYVGLLEKRYSELITEVKARVATTKDAVEALKATVSAQVDMMARDLTVLQIFYAERMEAGHTFEGWKSVERMHQQFHHWLAEGVVKGQAEGVFCPGDPKLYVMALQGMLMALFRNWVHGWENSADRDVHKQFLTDLSLKAICLEPHHHSAKILS